MKRPSPHPSCPKNPSPARSPQATSIGLFEPGCELGSLAPPHLTPPPGPQGSQSPGFGPSPGAHTYLRVCFPAPPWKGP